MAEPISHPDHVETPLKDQSVQGESDEGSGSGEAAVSHDRRPGTFDSERARAAALLRGQSGRRTEQTDLSILDDLIAGQVKIATKTPSVPPASRTAAAKAASDLMAERDRRRHAEQSSVVDWAAIPQGHRDAVLLILDMTEEQVQAAIAFLQGE